MRFFFSLAHFPTLLQLSAFLVEHHLSVLALDSLKRVADIGDDGSSNSAEIQLIQGEALLQSKQFEEARAALKSAVKALPRSDIRALVLLGGFSSQ